jgi:dihydroorotate dehydrogenase (fumarate)
MDLSTRYLGLTLAHPFVAGASPLADDLGSIRRLEDGGAAAIVLRSIFEEQITMARSGRIHHMDAFEPQFQPVLESFPRPEEYVLSPDEYLEHLRAAKAAAGIPIIASLNGLTPESWLTMATSLEEAGAAALELNPYEVVTDPDTPAAVIEDRILHLVRELRNVLRIPVAAKLSPYFTAFGNVAQEVLGAGADGLVLFNRFYETDIDIETIAPDHQITLSSRSELLVRLRWVAILRSRTAASLAVSGGVATPADGIKAILAGADAVQLVSAILRHGPSYFAEMREGLARWLDSKRIPSVLAARGRLSLPADADAGATERGNYLRLLQTWKADRSAR